MSDDYTPTTEEMLDGYVTMRRREMNGDPILASVRALSEADRWLAQYTAEKRAEWEAEASKDERLVRYMALVTPLGYQSALTAVESLTKMLAAEDIARRDAIAEQGETEPRDQIKLVDGRDPECVKAWPGCHTFGYDPACCRFPKSCSAGTIATVANTESEDEA